MIVTAIHRALGIPTDYGRNPFLPQFREADLLVDVGVDTLGRVQKLAPEAARAWTEMVTAARSDSVQLFLVSGFRSIEYQCALFEKKLAAGHSIDSILAVNAAPGFSQHHTGSAVDIGTPGIELLTEEFEHTEAFRWLLAHADTFAFSMPYPRNNRYGFIYEPWHWAHTAISI